ncbi:PcfB family protein [Butyrivibrio sp. INlla14]|uniref:PcfB family protein n=1 Tax=Butyrivibrio sp. INlla14 TaxID=1520808 RepID=UPI0008767D10|nr:PcfB family protein [Butyrivibrio sp. INlla14]SCY10960.1 Protein of unknown function [Butyrivibrio sp. INlla14]
MVNEELARESLRFVMDKGVKPTGRAMVNMLKAYIRHRHDKKYFGKPKVKTGKMSVKQLIKQGQGAQAIDLSGEGAADFKRIAKKYGVDYAIVKDKTTEPAHYKVFFKAKDVDAINSVIAEYTAKQMKKQQHPRASVLEKLKKFKEIVGKMPHKEHEHRKEQAR